MTYLLKLAFKNLFRHKLRTLVSIVAIMVAVIVVVFARGFISGMIDTAFADHIYYSSGHIKIINQEYQAQERLLPLNYPVDGFAGKGIEGMIKQIENIEQVKMVIPRIKFGATTTGEEELIPIFTWGIDPEKEMAFTHMGDYLVEGSMINKGKMQIVLGSVLLNKLNKDVGDKITIIYNTSFNSLKGATLEIVGRLESGLKLLDEEMLIMPIDQAQRLLYMDSQATELLLVAEDMGFVNQILAEVRSLLSTKGSLDKYLVQSYQEAGGLMPFLEVAKLIYNTIYIFLVGLASFVVISTMIMIVTERTREVGMMLALGMEGKNILQIFLIEGGLMGIFGSLLGALAGGAITLYFSTTGLDFSQAFKGMGSDVLFKQIIYPVSSWGNIVFAFILGVIIVTIACLIPARKAARMEPTEALRSI